VGREFSVESMESGPLRGHLCGFSSHILGASLVNNRGELFVDICNRHIHSKRVNTHLQYHFSCRSNCKAQVILNFCKQSSTRLIEMTYPQQFVLEGRCESIRMSLVGIEP